jgi:hypothetical protein
MKELINKTKISLFRSIGDISEERIRPYVREAQRLDVLPAVTQRVWDYIEQNLDEEIVKKLLIGGSYSYKGHDYSFQGLEATIAMFTYARIIRNNSINVTAFGVVQKTIQDSAPAQSGEISRAANEAFSVGVAYLKECVEYLKSEDDFDFENCAFEPRRRLKFRIIGD